MKAKIFTFLWAGLFFFAFGGVQAQNLLVDGDFSVTTEILPDQGGTCSTPNAWYYFTNLYNGVDALPVVESGACRYMVNYGGYNTWEVQLMQWGFPMIMDHTYRLSFDVKADVERWFGVFLGEEGGNWFSLLGFNQYWQHATTEWQTISLEFTVSQVFPCHKFSLEIGGMSGSVYFDNMVLEDLGKLPINVGFLGTAVDNWDVDVNMTTTDEIIYTLEDFPLKSGYCKFRQNDNWVVNWGNIDFPTGIGVQNGPDIPVYVPGMYDITFNRLTGEYNFVCSGICAPQAGILGTAVPPDYGWDTDLPMWSADGVNYKIVNLWLIDGEAKFRINDDSAQLWGGTGFPDGTAMLGGPPIPVDAGHYEVFFNLSTGEYHFIFPPMGILGSALNGWETDIDMATTDGNVYTLLNQVFTDGQVKFRIGDDWGANWGGYDFPTGEAIMGGPNITVMAGTYDVTFHIMENRYWFVATTCPVPGIKCPESIYVANDPGVCGAVVWYPEVVPAPNCGGGGVTIVQTAGLPSGSLFPVGTTTNSFLLTNDQGMTAECGFDVTVFDNEIPQILNLRAEYQPLWPPNHRMVPVTLLYDAVDNCGTCTCEVFVYSDEPENGTGDGNTPVDSEVTDAHHILLMAERSGSGAGRTYFILVVCHDEAWNSNYGMTSVFIPHDNRAKSKGGLKAAVLPGIQESVPFFVRLWPNPAPGAFYLESGGAPETAGRYSLTDVTGRILRTGTIMGQQTLRLGEDLVPGLYILRVTRGAESRAVKVIKK